MENKATDAWFYSQKGERFGPVTFPELKTLAAGTELSPRNDVVWTHGMADWAPAGEIDGLFERRPAKDAQEDGDMGETGGAPLHSSADVTASTGGDWPGARRRGFLIAWLIFPPLWFWGFHLASPFFRAQFGPEIMKFLSAGSPMVPLLVAIYFGFKRLRNLGMNRWWCLACFIPILNLWLGFRCAACPSGYAFHRKLGGTGISLAVIYWLLIAACSLAIFTSFALWFGIVGSLELQDLIREQIRTATAAIQ